MNIEENDDQLTQEEIDMLPELPIEEEQIITEERTQEEEQEESEQPEEVDEQELVAIQSFYDLLKERDLVEDKEVKSWDDVEEQIEKYKSDLPTQVRDSIIQSASPVAKDFIDYALTKKDLSQEDLKQYFEAFQKEQELESIETDEQAREILKKQYSNQFDEETVEIMLDSLQDKGTLQEKAKQSHEKLTQQLKEQAEQEAAQQTQEEQQYYDSVLSAFDEQPWKPQHIQKVKQSFQDGSLDRTIQEITKDPQSLVQLVNILNYYDSDKKQFNLDTFFNKAQTKQATSVRERIKNSAQNSRSSTRTNKAKSSGFDTEKYSLV